MCAPGVSVWRLTIGIGIGIGIGIPSLLHHSIQTGIIQHVGGQELFEQLTASDGNFSFYLTVLEPGYDFVELTNAAILTVMNDFKGKNAVKKAKKHSVKYDNSSLVVEPTKLLHSSTTFVSVPLPYWNHVTWDIVMVTDRDIDTCSQILQD